MWLARLGADRQAAHRLHTRATMSQPVPSDIRVQAPPLISEERDWAARVRAGDAAAFERAFRTYHAALCKFACRYVHSPEIAEELVHDVFARLWEERARLSVAGSRVTCTLPCATSRSATFATSSWSDAGANRQPPST